MKTVCETEILFDDFSTIESQLGQGYLNNNAAVNSDCVNAIYLPQDDEGISA